MTWWRCLSHCFFKTAVDSARGNVSSIGITDLPAGISDLDTCAACVAAKMVSLPHKVCRTRATEYLERVHVDIVGLMPILSAGGWEYLYILVDDCTRAVWTSPLHLKSEAFEHLRPSGTQQIVGLVKSYTK